ncbi:MAG: SapC family protein [Alphaproteobacteria bacterium]|jgi:hypothetical protein|nr:SapC family protein [Alphaproteobacteria bacterium]
MSETAQSPNASITGAALFYSNPEPLNVQMHSAIGLRRVDNPFAFAANTQAVPLTVGEFAPASLCFPVIFGGEKKQPLAVMGVLASINMFIKPDGFFEPGTYVPAYIRRYPFILAANASRENMVVCVDRGAAMLGDLPDLPFFDANGEATEYTKGCIQFCNDYEIEIRRTESFVELLESLDLFETRRSVYRPILPDGQEGPEQLLAEFWGVSQEKLKALPDAKLRELMDNGALGQIYAHIHSIGQFDNLLSVAMMRQAQGPTR